MKKTILILLTIIMLFLIGCSDTNQVKIDELKEAYPQSIEYFNEIQKCAQIQTKEERTTYIKELQYQINKEYPYDESLARDDIAIIDDVEDMGIIERFIMWADEEKNFSDELFYEATNGKNMINFSYHPNYKGYEDFEDSIDMLNITTGDEKIHSELCNKDKKELLLHDKVIDMMNEYNESKSFDKDSFIKELKEVSNVYQENHLYEDTYTYKFEREDEILNVVYDEKLKLVKDMGHFKRDDAGKQVGFEEFGYDKERDFYRVKFSLSGVCEVEEKVRLFERVIGE